MNIRILILAAGLGRRFGADKRFVEVGGEAMLRRTVHQALASGLPVTVALAEQDDRAAALLADLPAQWLAVGTRHGGMGDTLAAAVARMDRSHLLLALGDMPWIRPETYRFVAAQLGNGRIVRPVFEGVKGHPVGFCASFWPGLMALKGDSGARSLLDAHPEALIQLQVDDPGILMDVDVPDDLVPKQGRERVGNSKKCS